MKEIEKACDLCGLSVKINDFKLRTKQGDKIFCCEGCKGIYKLLHGDDVVDDDESNKENS